MRFKEGSNSVFRNDYVMRQIDSLVMVVSKMLFGKTTPVYERKDEMKPTSGERLHNELMDLVDVKGSTKRRISCSNIWRLALRAACPLRWIFTSALPCSPTNSWQRRRFHAGRSTRAFGMLSTCLAYPL